MFITLILIGLIQFFQLPQVLNYILLAIALIFCALAIKERVKESKR